MKIYISEVNCMVTDAFNGTVKLNNSYLVFFSLLVLHYTHSSFALFSTDPHVFYPIL